MRTKPATGLDMDRIHQRTVSANGAAPLASTGVRSVFDVAKDAEKERRKAKRPTPPFDALAVVIEKSVPIPEKRRHQGSKYEPLLARLTVNASAALPRAHEYSLRSASNAFAKKHAGRKFVVKVVSEADVRVWRTA